jgi:putative transferase (TIGR04331 family)
MSCALSALTPRGAGSVLFAELGLNRTERVALIKGSRFQALPYLAELPASARPAPVHDGRRKGLARLKGRDEFERIFIEALPVHLPTIFLEGHETARRFTLSRLWHTPKIVFTSVGCHYIDSFKFAAAECVERGSHLWGYQHGGGYGMTEHSPAELFERAISDRYYCWGWSRSETDSKLKDLPHPLLSRDEGPASPGNDILFVASPLDLYNIRLTRSTNNELASEYTQRQARFFRHLPDKIRRNFVIRLYRHDWGWRHRERLEDICVDMRFDDPNIPMPLRLRQARIAVFDAPSTPFLEAFAADIPVILTWKEESWPSRASARPLLDRLRSVGILFESPEESADQAARVYADPRAWWNEPERRIAVRAFTQAFALSSTEWLDAWLAEIRAGTAAR